MADGLHEYRFKKNPEEARIAEAWAIESARHLRYLLCEGDQRFAPEPSDRDKAVAATVIQWLGSPVGQAWLRDLGYER